MWLLNKIPKVLHLYWGNEKMSYLRFLTVLSFRKHNPDWSIKIHIPKHQYFGEITWKSGEHSSNNFQVNDDYFEKIIECKVEFIYHDFEEYGFRNDIPEVFKADYLRYKVLSDEGGVYSDFDILYLKSIEELDCNCIENAQFDTFLTKVKKIEINSLKNTINIAFIMSSPNNKLFGMIESLAKENLDVTQYQCIGANLLDRLSLEDQKICWMNKNNIFYLDFYRRYDIFDNNVSLEKDVIGIHWFAGTDIAQKYDSLINENNYSNIGSTISNCICKYVFEKDVINEWHLKNIPMIIHFYWGGGKISFLRYLTIYSFIKYNPSWKIKLHMPIYPYTGEKTWDGIEHQEGMDVDGEDYLDKIKSLDLEVVMHDFKEYAFRNDIPETFKADFLRYYLLYNEGGVWSDLDILYFKSMNDLYFNTYENVEVDTVLCWPVKKECPPIGFIFSKKLNPLFNDLRWISIYNLNLKDYQSIGSILLMTIPIDYYELNILYIKKEVVYDLDYTKTKDAFFNNVDLKKNAIGMHWYAGDLISQYYNNSLSPENYLYCNSTLSDVALKVFERVPKRKISLIIPSRKPEHLKYCLLCIAKQKINCEIIVFSKETEKEQTGNICKLFYHSLNIRHISIEQLNQTIEESYDAAVRLATGDIIVLLRPEVFFLKSDSETIRQSLSLIEKDANKVVLPKKIINDYNGKVFEYIDYNFGEIDDFIIPLQYKDIMNSPYFMVISKDKFISCGGYGSKSHKDFIDQIHKDLIEIDCELIHLYG